MQHQWAMPVPMSLDNSTGVVRMCLKCGYTQVLERGIAPPIFNWYEVEGSVVGDNCADVVVATDSTTLGYTPPAPS